MKGIKAAMASILIIFGCGSKAEPEAGADPQPQSSPKAWVTEGAALVDVRTQREFKRGHLQGALNIPLGELGGRIAEISADRVVVYCASGIRSKKAARMLKGKGKQVMDIGSMRGWDG